MAVLATEKALTRLPSGRTKSLKLQRYNRDHNHLCPYNLCMSKVCASNRPREQQLISACGVGGGAMKRRLGDPR